MTPLRALPLALALCSLGCRRAPDELAAPPSPVTLDAARATASPEALRARLAPMLDAAVTEVTSLDLGVASRVQVVAVRAGGRVAVAAVDDASVTLGIPGAERVIAQMRADGATPSTRDLVRIVGAFAYHPWPVYDARQWVPGPGGGAWSPAPQRATRPNGVGESLTFGYAIPEGLDGAGMHVAHFHLAPSGVIVDEAPHPERR